MKITVVETLGFTDWAPSVKALISRRTGGIGLAAIKPSLLVLVVMPGDDAREVLAFIDVREVRTDIVRHALLVFPPQ